MCVLHKLILTFTCKHKGLRTAKRLTKTKVGGIYKPNIQTCYKATVIKIMWQQPRNKGSDGMEQRVKKQVPVYINIWRMTEVVIQISDRKKILFFNKWCWDKWVSTQGEKNETGTLSYTIYRDQLQMNWAPKYGRKKLPSFLKRKRKSKFYHL